MSQYISLELRRRVVLAARNRCGYCLISQDLLAWSLEIDHLLPVAAGGTNDEENLWLACRACNGHKSSHTQAIDPLSQLEVALFNPRRQLWTEHFRWSADGGHVVGLTACGRATVQALQMNEVHAVNVRRRWATVGWHPPAD